MWQVEFLTVVGMLLVTALALYPIATIVGYAYLSGDGLKSSIREQEFWIWIWLGLGIAVWAFTVFPVLIKAVNGEFG
jgi:hypothetical protein